MLNFELFTVAFLLSFSQIIILEAEWVDLPQFSNGVKVYRLPMIVKQKNFQKITSTESGILLPVLNDYFDSLDELNFTTKNTNALSTHVETSSTTKTWFKSNLTISDGVKEDISTEVGQYDAEDEITEELGQHQSSKSKKISIITNFDTLGKIQSDENIDITVEEDNEEKHEDKIKEDEATQIQAPEQDDKYVTFHATDSTRERKLEITSILPCTTGSEEHSNEFRDKENNTFLDYLPIQLLEQVHNTLKAQPTTLKGKIRFLKAFEKALLSEIESRLAVAITPSRKTRGVSESHTYEDNIGFPSVEGALMAISFLTFAVYLIRLVMQLFHSIQNKQNMMPPTILLGTARRKKSLEEFTESTAKILSYIDKFDPVSKEYKS